MSEITKLERRIGKYEDAIDNIDLTIEKLNEAKGILEDKNNFSVSYANKIADDIDIALGNLKNTKTKIKDTISDIRSDIKDIKEQQQMNNNPL